MTRHLQAIGVTLAFALASTVLAQTQEKEKAPTAVTPLKVQVVIARYQGEKKISSMPYLLTMNVGQRSNLRMGTQVPVSVTTIDSKTTDGKPSPPGAIQYRDVGTNIDCSAQALDDGRFQMGISVDDSSVYGDDQAGAPKGNPSFRSFRTVNSMVLKNGETFQFTAATDKVTGETVRIEVTLTVLK